MTREDIELWCISLAASQKAGHIFNFVMRRIAAEREACAEIAAGTLGGYLCPYGRDKPGDPTWDHTDTDKCPVCGFDGNESATGCHDTVGARIASLIRARND